MTPVSPEPTSQASSVKPVVGAKKSGGPPPAADKAAVTFDKESFKNDPLIAKALELFKGTIVDVRG